MDPSRDPLLLTPGPLTTSAAVRDAMDRDMGSRDAEFVALNAEVRRRLVAVVAAEPEYTCVPVQGSGTFAVEAALGTLVPRSGKVLACVNGAYGARIRQICQRIGRDVAAVECPEERAVDPEAVDRALAGDPGITHVALAHCETTTGLLNPVPEVAAVAAARGRRLIVDAMSAFGALPLRAEAVPFEAVVASSNKCLEGVPGVGFVVARAEALAAAAGNSPSLALDLHDQWRAFEANGQWRFTPPVQVLAALAEALRRHADEGGVEGRGARYRENLRVLQEGMGALGFVPLLAPPVQAPIIVTWRAPGGPWSFEVFYRALRERGFAIYPGKLTQAPTFRVGCIGQVFPDDIRRFVAAVGEVMEAMGLPSGAPGAGEGGA